MAGAAAAIIRKKKKKKMSSSTPSTAPASSSNIIFSSSNTNDRRWEVEFSRFFNFPVRSPSALSHLHPLPKFKTRKSGTWIVAESPATLRIFRSSEFPVITALLAGLVVEEHYVTNLHYSWPRISCVPECPVRGSRVVFLSYRTTSEQIQKFAVRFPTVSDVETFLRSIKECLHDSLGITRYGCDVVCENSSPSELTASNGLHSRISEESSNEEPIAACAPEFPALTYNDEQLEPFLANNIDTIFSSLPPSFTEGLPPSFTDLLSNCSTGAKKEQSRAGANTKCTSSKEGSLNPPLNPPSCGIKKFGSSEPPILMAEQALQAQIVQYMTDASFHDLLFKIEKVMNDLGGDLFL